MQITNIEKALRIVGKGALAKEVGLTRAAVYVWGKKNKIPPHYILKVEELSGISRYDLAPDIYGTKPE